MPEDIVPSEEALGNIKQSSKHQWRGKIWSTEGRFGEKVESKESTSDDIANFLQAGGTKANTTSLPTPTAPRIDIAVTRKPLPVPQVSPSELVDVYRRPKPRQNKGLRVTFEKAAPEIIGEGGDEAELPARDVTKPYQNVASLGQVQDQEPAFDAINGRSPEPLWCSPDPGDGAHFRPPPLQRRPTGVDELPIRSGSSDKDQDTGYEDSIHSVSPEGTHKPLPEPPLEWGKNTHEYGFEDHAKRPYRDPSPIRPGFDEHAGMVSSLDVPTLEILASNSVTPRASPKPAVNYQGSSVPNHPIPHAAIGMQSPPKFSNPEYQVERQPIPKAQSLPQFSRPEYLGQPNLPSERLAAPDPKAFSLRNVAKGLGNDSLDDFELRVRRFNGIFRLGVSAHGDLNEVSFVQWIRTAVWWFVKGRDGIESAVRGKSLDTERIQPGNGAAPSTILDQAWLDLAKAWWIIRDITPKHPEIIRFGNASMSAMLPMIKNFGDQVLAELIEVHSSVVVNMRALTMSMKRNEMLPPNTFEIQRLDPRILLDLPNLPSAFTSLAVNNTSAAPIKSSSYVSQSYFPTLVGDTERFFSFGRMFAEASPRFNEDSTQNVHISCILCLLRERNSWGVKATIASQDAQINLVIQANQDGGLTWRDIQWKIPLHAMQIKLSESVDLSLQFSEKDFKTLWGIYDYTRRVLKDFTPRKDEELIFERNLESFYSNDPDNFPSDPVPECRLRLFQRRSVKIGEPGQRKVHDGCRLTVVTPPDRKSLSSVNYVFGKEQPLLFSYAKSKDGHRLVLKMPSNVNLSPVFHETPDRELFRSLLCDTSISQEDTVYGSLPLRSLAITAISARQIFRPGEDHAFQWSKLRMVNRGPPPYDDGASGAIGSGHLRMMAESDIGTLTDRLNLGPGELQMSLSVENMNEIMLLRPPQQDMTWSMLDGRVSEEELQSVCNTLHRMATSRTIRTYHLRSTSTLHSFQTIITGFQVLFDGSATNFAISRRRMVVPMHKRWEATSVRLQILKNDKVVQLVAFFKDFSHGACMNLVLKVTDVFEVFSKSGMFYLCLADAKFALPKGEEDQTRDFVCLDTPEYPSEHDDITIGFDNEQGTSALMFFGVW